MKKIFLVTALVALLLASCVPAPKRVSVTQMATNLVDYALTGVVQSTDLVKGVYTSQHLVQGEFVNPGFDCNAGILQTDARMILLDSVVRLIKKQDIQDIVDPPGVSSYTVLQTWKDGRDLNSTFLGPAFQDPYQDTPGVTNVELVTSTITIGPCGFIAGDGWLYGSTESGKYPGAVQRHSTARAEGKFLLNPKYLIGNPTPPVKQYTGNQWVMRTIDASRIMISHGDIPSSIICNSIKQFAWMSLVKDTFGNSDPTNVDVYDSQKTNGYVWSYQPGDAVAVWGDTYPPKFKATIRGAGWVSDGHNPVGYVIFSIPDQCTK